MATINAQIGSFPTKPTSRRSAIKTLAVFPVQNLQSKQTEIVATARTLHQALDKANQQESPAEIKLLDGVYSLEKTLQILRPNIRIVSISGKRDSVILEGDAMSESASIKNLIRVASPNFYLDGVTLRKAGWHAIQISGEYGASNFTIRNCTLQNTWQQLLKITGVAGSKAVTNGSVESCYFEYSSGIGPQWYIGGIDAHAIARCRIVGNVFKNIASPMSSVCEHAIHLWSGAQHNLVEQNLIIDCDRGIGFGSKSSSNQGGIIRNNFIYHSANSHPFADVGIVLENSPSSFVYNNTIYFEHNYANAIEYRFKNTRDALLMNNLTNKRITAQWGSQGTLLTNKINVEKSHFKLAFPGDLQLADGPLDKSFQGTTVHDLHLDFYGKARPKHKPPTVGAHQK